MRRVFYAISSTVSHEKYCKINALRGSTFLLRWCFFIILVCILLVPFISPTSDAYAVLEEKHLLSEIVKLQVPFIENQGQLSDKSIRFYASTFTGPVYITEKGEIVYSLLKSETNQPRSVRVTPSVLRKSPVHVFPLKEGLLSPIGLRIQGTKRSVAKISYFKGNREKWRTNIPAWDEISIGEVYRDIELKFRSYGRQIEKVFTVNPGGSVGDIKLTIKGAKALRINREGELVVETNVGKIKFTKPVAYQLIKGQKMMVNVEYTVSKSSSSTHVPVFYYGFKVGRYDPDVPLVIDPMLESTFLGGSNSDFANDIVVDNDGDIYVTGYTSSSDFPVTDGALDTTLDYRDIFISRFDSNLRHLLSSTFIGGTDAEYYPVMALDNNGNIYITGDTHSADFPVTPLAFDTTLDGFYDIFIVKLNGELNNILASTFLGGGSGPELEEAVLDIGIDGNGNLYVVGTACTTDFPVTPDAFDTENECKGFISKFDSNLQNLLASTFFGGSGDEEYAEVISSLAFGRDNDIYVVGSTQGGLPITPGAYDTTFNCIPNDTCGTGDFTDAFIARFDTSLQDLLSATYLGSLGVESGKKITVEPGGDVTVIGETAEAFGIVPDFPVTEGAFDTTFNGTKDAFIARFDDLSNVRDPLPDIKTNGSDGPVNLNHGDPLSVTIELACGNYCGDNADWWVIAVDPFNKYYYYDFQTDTWAQKCTSCYPLSSYQSPLVNMGTYEVLSAVAGPQMPVANTPDLPSGTYTFYFGVDLNMNGKIDMGQMYYDSVEVSIIP
jgi:hypothetical protein